MQRWVISSKILRLGERCCARLCIGLILIIRSLLGPASCRYTVGCTTYALAQLKTMRLHQALWNITKRILACSPMGYWMNH